MYSDEKINEVIQKAQNDFWDTIAGEFPEITSGDSSPEETIIFDKACKRAVDHWLLNEWPD